MKTGGKVLLCLAPLIIAGLLCLADDGRKLPGTRETVSSGAIGMWDVLENDIFKTSLFSTPN